MNTRALEDERQHLADLLEALHRTAFFLHASVRKLAWPLEAEALKSRQKDVDLFETLAAFNERFAKLQDTLGACMRHAALLMGEPASPFLKVLALFEKLGVINSIESWQLIRAARNLAAHDYETDYRSIAQHFNELHALHSLLIEAAARLIEACEQTLEVRPASDDFRAEFMQVVVSVRA